MNNQDFRIRGTVFFCIFLTLCFDSVFKSCLRNTMIKFPTHQPCLFRLHSKRIFAIVVPICWLWLELAASCYAVQCLYITLAISVLGGNEAVTHRGNFCNQTALETKPMPRACIISCCRFFNL